MNPSSLVETERENRRTAFAGWCAARELNVVRNPDHEADRIIEGHRVEIKLSMRWRNGSYTFQQIRDQDYEYLVCLGPSPFDAHAWIFRKAELPFRLLKHQHGGRAGRDTWWLTFPPDRPPNWIAKVQTGKARPRLPGASQAPTHQRSCVTVGLGHGSTSVAELRTLSRRPDFRKSYVPQKGNNEVDSPSGDR